MLWKYMDQYHESQTAGKCIATSSHAKHDMSQARLYRINDYDVEQNYEKSCLASVPQQYLIHKQHKHLDISDQPKSNAILNAILLYAMQYLCNTINNVFRNQSLMQYLIQYFQMQCNTNAILSAICQTNAILIKYSLHNRFQCNTNAILVYR